MVNINKDIIKKIKEIDTKADAVLTEAEKKAETIILDKRHDVQSEVKDAQIKRDLKKASIFETAKKEAEEHSKQMIEKGISKSKEKELNIEPKTLTASDIVVELFIKKIENIDLKNGD